VKRFMGVIWIASRVTRGVVWFESPGGGGVGGGLGIACSALPGRYS
jgi:hypothetical protein